MATLSFAEMYVHNAMKHGFIGTTIAFIVGAGFFYGVHPYFPDFESSKEVGFAKLLSSAWLACGKISSKPNYQGAYMHVEISSNASWNAVLRWVFIACTIFLVVEPPSYLNNSNSNLDLLALQSPPSGDIRALISELEMGNSRDANGSGRGISPPPMALNEQEHLKHFT